MAPDVRRCSISNESWCTLRSSRIRTADQRELVYNVNRSGSRAYEPRPFVTVHAAGSRLPGGGRGCDYAGFSIHSPNDDGRRSEVRKRTKTKQNEPRETIYMNHIQSRSVENTIWLSSSGIHTGMFAGVSFVFDFRTEKIRCIRPNKPEEFRRRLRPRRQL